MKLAVAGGGTAGHVNPAIALGRALQPDDVVFIGSSDGAEATLVPAAGFTLETIEVRGFDRARPFSLPATGWRALGAVRTARRLLKRMRPAAVIGMGGYVSLPVCVAARTMRIPVVLHEQNIVLGLANRVCKPFARVLAVSFEETLQVAGRKGVFVGNPVGRDVVSFDRDTERARALERFSLDASRLTVLVFGGSQGAQRINEATAGLAEKWHDRAGLQVVHIVGRKQSPLPDIATGGLIYRRVSFVERMVEAYAVADLAVCRGGATTLAELTVVGLPAVVIPYPYHRDRQQERQGRVLERAGAAVILDDAETTPERLAAEVERLINDRSRLDAMRAAARTLARPDAAERLAGVVRRATT
ncbi:MAG: undecaprenyldiphospho-muramoylpentapeptide beta-N-acetylglucosaminyltransferase [Actinomycetota bacterium]|nr:undecaprenyldiphospho-muramoylpentapeptide beta-N-acetylglucosaminyltransferase [Actinomycetota bacterium]